MSAGSLVCITANFAGASPLAVKAERRVAASLSAAKMRTAGVDVVFAQEVPDAEWVAEWTSADYEVAFGAGRRYAVRSAVIWRRGLPISPLELPTAGYHGSYLASAQLRSSDSDLLLLSVHASPNPVAEPYLSAWDDLVPDTAPGRPRKRAGGGRYEGEWFDSDFVLGTSALLTGAWGSLDGREVLVAGDFNECRQWDEVEEGNWGADFFANVEDAGLVDVTWAAWNEERPTCIASGRHLQLDHVLATAATAERIKDPKVARLVADEVERGASSDHAVMQFKIAN